MAEEPLTVRIEASGKPWDVTVKTPDGRVMDNVIAVKWSCDSGDPVPHATIELSSVGTAVTVRPSIVLLGLGDLRFPLPDGLTATQLLELDERVGDLATTAHWLSMQRARLLREIEKAGVSLDVDALLAEPESDLDLKGVLTNGR